MSFHDEITICCKLSFLNGFEGRHAYSIIRLSLESSIIFKIRFEKSSKKSALYKIMINWHFLEFSCWIMAIFCKLIILNGSDRRHADSTIGLGMKLNVTFILSFQKSSKKSKRCSIQNNDKLAFFLSFHDKLWPSSSSCHFSTVSGTDTPILPLDWAWRVVWCSYKVLNNQGDMLYTK